MDFGKIKKKDSEISLNEWNLIIESRSNFESIPDKEGVNPFTNEKVVFSGEGKAYFIEGGEKVGNISSESGVLFTTGVPLDVCKQVAIILNAEAYEDDRS